MSRNMYDVNIKEISLRKLDENYFKNKPDNDSGISLADLLLSFNNPNIKIEEVK